MISAAAWTHPCRLRGFTDAWAVHEAGYHAVVAWASAHASEKQLDLVAKLSIWTEASDPGRPVHRPVMVLGDSDPVGDVNAARAVRGLQARHVTTVCAVTEYGGGIADPAAALRRVGARQFGETLLKARIAAA
jgi:hypothetical protein